MKKILIFTFVFLVLLGIFILADEEEIKDEKGFIYDSKEKIYSNELKGVKTEIKNNGEFTLSKWNEEIKMTIKKPNIYPLFSLTNVKTVDNKILTKTSNKIDLKYYMKNVSNNVEGFEYEIILNEKPSTNKISMDIQTENLDFYYQPPLYLEHGLVEPNATCNATNCHNNSRPINVVGSYAVYHSNKKHNQYQTGKAFHIYRPLIIDADNDTIWGEMSIEKSVMIITINQDWLDNAIYPIIVDPSFGYETGGSSWVEWDYSEGILKGTGPYIGSNGTGVNISAYIHLYRDAGPPAETIPSKCAIYKNQDFPIDVVKGTEEFSYTVSETFGPAWKNYSFTPDNPTFNDTTYYHIWIAGRTSTGANSDYFHGLIAYDSSNKNSRYIGLGYTAFPEDLADAGVESNRTYSLYVIYTSEEAPPSDCWTETEGKLIIPPGCKYYTNIKEFILPA